MKYKLLTILFLVLAGALFFADNVSAVITAGNYTLKASGGDYATLQAFLDDLGNLTGDLTLTVDAGTYNETVLAGVVTESLNGYTLWIKPASFPTTTDGTTGVIFNVNVGAGANFIESKLNGAGTFIIEGLNFTYTTNRPHYIAAIYSAAAGYNFIIRRCVFKQAYEGAIYIYDGDPTYNIYNNVIIGSMGASASYGFYVRGINFKGYISNNTVIDVAGASTGYGLGQESAGNTGLFENNIAYNSKTSDFRNVGSCTGNNNASKDATADDFGAGGNAQISIADPFTNSATYDLTLVAGSAPIGNGKDLSGSFTTDFFGNTRTTWDIGAVAYIPPFSAQFTLSAWVKPTTAVATKALAVKNNELRLVTDANGKPVCQIHNGTAWQTGATSATALTLNSWQYVSCVYDRGNIKIYINGVLQATQSMSDVDIQNTVNALDLGHDAGGTYGDFEGKIDEFRYYKYARNASQIKVDYNFGKALAIGESKEPNCDSDPAGCVNKGLVGYWDMDQMGGQTASDKSGSGNNGTLGADANPGADDPLWKSGVQPFSGGGAGGGALSFDGVDDYVDAGTSSTVMPTQITVSAWIKTATTTILPVVYKRTGANDFGYGLAYYNQRFNGFISTNGTSWDAEVYPATLYPTNTWLYFTMTFNGSVLTGYVNGVSVGTANKVGSIFNSSAPLLIGKSTTYYFNGSIDDVRIYNRALSEAEIRYQYNQGDPIAHWKFDEQSWNGTAGEVKDSVGTNNGTSTGGANTTSTAVFGRAGSFDGVDDYVSIPDNVNLRPSASNWSVSAWAKFPNSNQMANFVSKRQNGGTYEQYSMTISDGTTGFGVGKKFTFSFLGDNSLTKRQAKTTVADVVDGNWHLYTAVVIRGSDIKLYVDGVEKSSTWFYNLGWPDLIDNTDPLQIGYGNGSGYTNGFIDDVRIYDYALTADQVRRLYNADKAMYVGGSFKNGKNCDASPADCVNDGLVGYWDMDQMAGQTATDKSGLGNNGTLGTGATPDTSDPVWTRGVQPLSGGKAGGGALQFDGVNDFVQVTVPQVDTTAGGYNTVSFWMKWDGTTVKVPFAFQNSGLYCLYIHSNSCMGFNVASADAYGISPTTLNLANRWAHITLVFYNGAYTGNNKIYVDGVSQTLTQCLGSAQSGTAQTIAKIGKITTGYYFTGSIDDVRIYNRALSEEEIRYQYNQGKPIAWWKMDEGADTATTCDATISSVYDYSGQGNNGVLYNPDASPATSSMWTEGKYNCGIDFDGTDDYVDAGSGASIDISGAFTVSAWVKPVTDQSAAIVSKYSAIPADYELGLGAYGADTTGHAFIRVDTVATSKNAVDQNELPLGTWSNVIGVWDGSSTLYLYVNGKLATTTTGISRSSTRNDNMNIGRRPYVGSYIPFNGSIDDVRVYNYARTADQIRADYNSGSALRQ